MKQAVGLFILAFASAATVSAQVPTYLGALVISRASFFHLSIAPRSLLKSKYSLSEQRKVSDITTWVCLFLLMSSS